MRVSGYSYQKKSYTHINEQFVIKNIIIINQ